MTRWEWPGLISYCEKKQIIFQQHLIRKGTERCWCETAPSSLILGGKKTQKTPAALPEISLLKTSGLKSANKPYSSSNQTFQGWRSHKNMGIDQKQQQCPRVSYSTFTSLKGSQVIVTLCESRTECGSQAYTTKVTYMTFTLHYTDNGKQLELWRYWKSCKLGNYIKKQNKPKQKNPNPSFTWGV